MSVKSLTEREQTQVEAEEPCASETSAEAYQRHRTALNSLVPEVRLAAVRAMVECGSSAVFPLLRAIEDDEDREVVTAALWSLLRVTDDMLGGKHEERDTPDAILNRGRLTEPYLRLGIEAVAARSVGGSPANVAYAWVHRLDPRSHEAGIRFLSDLVQKAPDLDPQLPDVLRRMSRRHPLPWIRPHGLRLLREFEEWRIEGELPLGALLAQSLAVRRLAASEAVECGELNSMATSDPDRAVRHIAGARLYRLVLEGAVIRTPGGLTFKDEELRYLFFEGRDILQAHPSPATSLKRIADASVRSRRCVLRLLTHLRPLVGGIAGADLDEFVRVSMRDPDREVRREATSVARLASSSSICKELTGRLREQLRKSPPALLLAFPILWLCSLGMIYCFRSHWWAGMLPHVVNAVLLGYIGLRDRGGQHGITHFEYLETLTALEPVADSTPEMLISFIPELRQLTSRGIIDSRVRAKARELLAKVHEATLHELPIAATAPAVEPVALPIPGAAPETREVVAR